MSNRLRRLGGYDSVKFGQYASANTVYKSGVVSSGLSTSASEVSLVTWAALVPLLQPNTDNQALSVRLSEAPPHHCLHSAACDGLCDESGIIQRREPDPNVL